jgi:hypothetical protein
LETPTQWSDDRITPLTTYVFQKQPWTIKERDSAAPEVMKAFWAFDKAAVADGAIVVVQFNSGAATDI